MLKDLRRVDLINNYKLLIQLHNYELRLIQARDLKVGMLVVDSSYGVQAIVDINKDLSTSTPIVTYLSGIIQECSTPIQTFRVLRKKQTTIAEYTVEDAIEDISYAVCKVFRKDRSEDLLEMVQGLRKVTV